MYVLMYQDEPLAIAERSERLNEYMADPRFTALQQSVMVIVPDVEVLR